MRKRSTIVETFVGLNWTLAGTLLTALGNVLVLVVLSRILSPHEFGVASSALVIMNLSLILSEVGMGPALIHREQLTAEHISSAILFSILLALGAMAAVLALSAYFADLLKVEELEIVLPYISILFVLRSLTGVGEAVLLRERRFKVVAVIRVGSFMLGYVIVSVLLAWRGWSYWSLVIGLMVQAILETIAFSIVSKLSLSNKFKVQALRELLGYGMPFTLNRIFANMALQGDNFIIVRGLGTVALGLYSRAYQLFTFPVNLLGQSINKVIFPILSRQRDDLTVISKFYIGSSLVIGIISGPATAISFVYASDIVIIVLGEGWEEVVGALQCLSLSFFFRLGYKVLDPIVNAVGNIRRKALWQATYAACVVVFATIALDFGIDGVALAVSAAIVIYYLLLSADVVRLLKVTRRELLLTHGLFLLFLIGNFAVCQAMKWCADQWHPGFSLLCSFGITMITSIALCFLCRRTIIVRIEWVFKVLPERFKFAEKLM